MMTISWKIDQLERQSSTGGVVLAHWRCTANEDAISSSVYGSVSFTPDPSSPNFVPFDNLAESDVLAWVWGQVSREETEASLAAQINAQKHPVVIPGLPWG